MTVEVEKFGIMKFQNVLVANTEKTNRVMLIGRQDMDRLGTIVDFKSKKVSVAVGPEKGRRFAMRREVVKNGTINQFDDGWGQFHIRAIGEDNQPKNEKSQICNNNKLTR